MTAPGRALTILCVDDEPAIRRYLEAALRALGAEVFALPGADLAVDAVAAAPPDVVLLDWLMPGLSGAPAVAALRAAGARYIVICSAMVGPDEADFLRRSGADEFLPKPCRIEDLEAALIRWAARS